MPDEKRQPPVGETESGSSSPKTATGSSGAAAVILVILLACAPLLYVLAIGPLVWLESRNYIEIGPDSGIAKFYAPVEWAVTQSNFVSSALMAYIMLWASPDSMPMPTPQLPAPATPPTAMPAPPPQPSTTPAS
jgi:hypothetical protein